MEGAGAHFMLQIGKLAFEINVDLLYAEKEIRASATLVGMEVISKSNEDTTNEYELPF